MERTDLERVRREWALKVDLRERATVSLERDMELSEALNAILDNPPAQGEMGSGYPTTITKITDG